jgi:ribonuclease HI
VRSPGLIPLANQVQALRKRFEHVAFAHVPRSLNKQADALANRALDGGT